MKANADTNTNTGTDTIKNNSGHSSYSKDAKDEKTNDEKSRPITNSDSGAKHDSRPGTDTSKPDVLKKEPVGTDTFGWNDSKKESNGY